MSLTPSRALDIMATPELSCLTELSVHADRGMLCRLSMLVKKWSRLLPAQAAPRLTGTAKSGDVRFRLIDLGVAQEAKKSLRIAVTTPRFDDMGKLSRTLGDGYRFETVSIDDLVNPAWMDRFDILFLTCDGWSDRAERQATPARSSDRASLYGTYPGRICSAASTTTSGVLFRRAAHSTPRTFATQSWLRRSRTSCSFLAIS